MSTIFAWQPRLALLPMLTLMAGNAMAIEEPAFTVVYEGADFEIRHYESYLVAETEVEGNFGDAGKAAFRILAGYIFGDNRSVAPSESKRMEMTAPVISGTSEKMEMTAPVISESAEKMDMTAPVISETGEAAAERYTYRFVMESKYTRDTLPIPNDPRVKIREIKPRTIAVRRFNGFWTERNYEKNKTKLLTALRGNAIPVVGDPKLARYNGPFTPWFLRRNEVMVEIDWSEARTRQGASSP